MERISKFGWAAGLIAAPVLALLCSCMESITPEETVDVLLPVNVLTSSTPMTEATTETTVTTVTTVTINRLWQENAIENYRYNGGVVIENVPHATQFVNYPTACESMAAVALLQYYGVNIDIDRFLDEFLPRTDYPTQDETGNLQGASPWEYFIGDPRDSAGFGCYNTCIAAGINKIQEGLAIPLNDLTLDEICSEYIDKGQPVVMWGTIGMEAPYVSKFHWTIPDGTEYYFVNPEHACVLIGYDASYYYFSDSMSYETITAYSRLQVETAYEGLFRQTVAIDPLVLETLPDFWRTDLNGETE